jgi:hypothetical protein
VARVRCIQCLKLLRCQCQREGDGVFLYMRGGAGFGNSNDLTAANGPSQRNGCRRATARCTNTCERGVTQQPGGGATERRTPSPAYYAARTMAVGHVQWRGHRCYKPCVDDPA